MRPDPGLTFSTADLNLAARLEAAEAANGMVMAESIRTLLPESEYQPFAGGVAIYAGRESPMTHALGLGMRGTVPLEELERLEEFFFQRGSGCAMDLCSMADPSVLTFVQSRPYKVVEFNNILVRSIPPDASFPLAADTRRVPPEEMSEWGTLVSRAFSEHMPVTEASAKLLTTTCRTAQCWFVGDGPDAAGGAAMATHEGVALFLGDAVLSSSRRKGLQARLIYARLSEAQRQDVRLAMVSVLPGSASHRNFERAGFQLIYVRVNLVRDLDTRRVI